MSVHSSVYLAAKVHCVGEIKCCSPSICLSVCPLPTIYWKLECHRKLIFIGSVVVKTLEKSTKTEILEPRF